MQTVPAREQPELKGRVRQQIAHGHALGFVGHHKRRLTLWADNDCPALRPLCTLAGPDPTGAQEKGLPAP
ncbi:hypothetical protein Shyhy02_08420 [Streptomyces hygroscopicus subsp. hygroscopicus]|nr:hypothetical protein Shyhy02_08420 [Streptomyces hygroscopicus subsp. hygroscopicus]